MIRDESASQSESDYNESLMGVVGDLVDSCIMDGVMNMHRAIKLGYFHIVAPDSPSLENSSDASSSQNPNCGSRESANKGHSCCRCVKCNCKVAATRYASHLSNCMGLGRNSSRRANKRIAEQQRLEDYDEDAEEEIAIESSLSTLVAEQSHVSAQDGLCVVISTKDGKNTVVSSSVKSDNPAKHSRHSAMASNQSDSSIWSRVALEVGSRTGSAGTDAVIPLCASGSGTASSQDGISISPPSETDETEEPDSDHTQTSTDLNGSRGPLLPDRCAILMKMRNQNGIFESVRIAAGDRKSHLQHLTATSGSGRSRNTSRERKIHHSNVSN